MLRKVRIFCALVFFVLITLMFLDITGTMRQYFDWMAKIQLLPAVLALQFGIIVGLVVITLVLGRVYCSIICPLGVMQDIFTWKAKWLAKLKFTKRKKFNYSPALNWLRYTVLAVFVIALAIGIPAVFTIFAPYSAYGRIASELFAPVYGWGNNLLAYFAERADSYAFYSTEVWMKGTVTLILAIVTLVIIGFLAWRHGRTYCNTICPVGTVLGFLSRFSLLKVRIDTDTCTHCNACSRACKASCIDSKHQKIDYSRCVACFDCIDKCTTHSLIYALPSKTRAAVASPSVDKHPDEQSSSRRQFFALTTLLATSAWLKAQDVKKRDGGFAPIVPKKAPERETPVTPPGSVSAGNMAAHCTACQLCVSSCPSHVLSPSLSLSHFMQPVMSFERGYCRPECVACAEVCPTDAIFKIAKEYKAAIQVGHAVWVRERCVVQTDKVSCGNCARHCPTTAILMVKSDIVGKDGKILNIPAVNENKCIGCGACENLCPSAPVSAIYVVGHEVHHYI